MLAKLPASTLARHGGSLMGGADAIRAAAHVQPLQHHQRPSGGNSRAMRDHVGNMPPLPGVFPDYFAPIVRSGEDRERELVMARWGMPSPFEVLKGNIAILA